MENRKSREQPVGICFLCRAGRCQVPFEDFSDHARWVDDGCGVPWLQTPSLLKLFHDPEHPSRFFKPDLFHNFHGGAGKDWLASALTECLILLPGASKDAKIEAMAAIMRTWSEKSSANRPHSGDFCADRIGLTSYQVCPEASWSKHNDTCIYMRFLEFFLAARPEIQANEKLRVIYQGTCAANLCFQLLYEGGLWLPKQVACQAASLGRFWLQAYGVLAALTHAEGFLRFSLHPKLHYLDHSWRCMEAQATATGVQ